MSIAFWSVELKKGKSAEVQPPEGYVLNLQNAAVTGGEGKAAQVFATTANIEGEEMKTLITTLRSGKTDQCQLSLVFGFDVPVQFSMGGDENKASVFLSGYFQPGPDDDEDMGDEEDEYGEYGEEGEDVDDSEDDEDRAALYKQLAMGMGGGLHNDDSDDDEDSEDDEAESGGRVQQLDDSEDEEDDEEDSEDEALDEEFISKMIQKNAKGSSTGGSGSKSVEKAMKALAASEPPAKKAKHEGGGSKGQQKGGDKKSAKDSKHGKSGDKRKR